VAALGLEGSETVDAWAPLSTKRSMSKLRVWPTTATRLRTATACLECTFQRPLTTQSRPQTLATLSRYFAHATGRWTVRIVPTDPEGVTFSQSGPTTSTLMKVSSLTPMPRERSVPGPPAKRSSDAEPEKLSSRRVRRRKCRSSRRRTDGLPRRCRGPSMWCRTSTGRRVRSRRQSPGAAHRGRRRACRCACSTSRWTAPRSGSAGS